MEIKEKDSMATVALVAGSLLILTVVVFLLSKLVSVFSAGEPVSEEVMQQAQMEMMQERMAKIGSVVTFDPSAEKKVRSGEEIVNGVCGTCHATGVLQAPKIGESGEWQPRFSSLGLTGLVSSAIKGKNAMPAKGGDPSLTDDEMQVAIEYMLEQSDIDPSATAEASADVEPAAEAAAAPAVEASETASTEPETEATPAEVVVEANEATSETEEAVAAVVEADNAATTASELVVGEPSTGSFGAAASTAEDAPKNVVSAVKEKATAAAVAVTAAVATVTGNADEAPAKATTAIDPAVLEAGKKIYKTACFACHDSGVAGAPKITDAAAWQPRLVQGMDALYSSAINGKNAMPPKGGRIDLSDDDIASVVDYMVHGEH